MISIAEKSVATTCPNVIAVVLNWNGFEDTEKCVRSLESASYPALRIVIVDNNSDDGSAARLAAQFPHVPFLRRAFNGGYAAGNNDGIRYAMQQGADYVLLINNDVVAEPDFLIPMIELAESSPEIGVVTCKAFFQSDRERIYCTAGYFSRWRCAGVSLPSRDRDREGEVRYISGCILLVKRKVFETAGLLDEKFFMYYEDVEFARRVKKRYKLAYTPRGIVYHKSGAGDRWKNYTETYLYYTTRNRFWAFRHESFPYQIYVFLFSILNVLGKSFVIMANQQAQLNRRATSKRLSALWRGLRDGVFSNPPAPNGEKELCMTAATSAKLSTEEHWKEVYDDLSRYQDLYLYQQQLVEIIDNQFSDLNGVKILEVGCGKGNEIVQLAKRGAACVGLDFSESAMDLMQQRLAKESLVMPLVRGDARKLPFHAGYFDLVYSQGVLEHFAQPGEVLQEQYRILREGGIIVVEVPNKWTLYTIYKKVLMAAKRWLPGWETQYSPRELKSLLEQSGFRILDCVGWDFLILKALRKIRKKLGLRDKPESSFARTLRYRFQRNPILLNFFISLIVVGKKT